MIYYLTVGCKNLKSKDYTCWDTDKIHQQFVYYRNQNLYRIWLVNYFGRVYDCIDLRS